MGIKEIARLAGVSVATVSNVLNGKANVGGETRRKVLAICEEVGYSPALAGKRLKTGANNTVVFTFSDFDRGFYLHIIEGVSDYLSENGYDLIICTNRSSVNFMNKGFTSGAISLDAKISNEYLEKTAGKNYPLVVMDRIARHEGIRSVVADNYPAMCELTQKAVEKGYRNFGFLSGQAHTLDNKERFQAFLDTLCENGIEFNQNNHFHGDYREKSGYQAARIMLLSRSVPQILMCANDNMAAGAIKAFRENGLEVPGDVAVTGFDNSEAAEILGITTADIPRYESGYLAAKALLGMIRGEAVKPVFKISIRPVWRQTM